MNIYAAAQKRESRGLPFRRAFQQNLSWVQRYECSSILRGHQGCVNAIQWSKDGRLLCSGSDDRCVMLWDFQGCREQGASSNSPTCSLTTLHRHNIFDAHLTADSEEVVSCGADGCVCVTTVESPTPASRMLFEPDGPDGGHYLASKIAFASHAGPRSFFVTFGDGRVRMFDVREASHQVAVCSGGVGLTGIELQPTNCMTLAIGGNDPFLRLYDLRALKMTSEASSRSDASCVTPVLSLHTTEKLISSDVNSSERRIVGMMGGSGISGLSWSADGKKVLANYRSNDVILFDMAQRSASDENKVVALPDVKAEYSLPTENIHLGMIRSYEGRVNVQTCAKEVRFLCGGAAVGTGGDCGNFFIWDASSGKMLRKLPADRCIVNCVAPHPHLPLVCTSGIDSEIKTWDIGDERIACGESRKRWAMEGRPSDATNTAFWGRRRREAAPNATAAEAKERMKAAEQRKQRGNTLVKQAGWTEALDQYQEALKELHFLAPNGRTEGERQALAIGCWLNCSYCHLNLEDYSLAVEMCSKVLEIESSNIKAYFRRASALGEMREFDKAFEDIEAALNIEESNSDILKLRTRLQKQQRHRQKRERDAYKRLFASPHLTSSEVVDPADAPVCGTCDTKDGACQEPEEHS